MKASFVIFIIIIICCAAPAKGQGCLPGNTTLSTQNQIDSFNFNYPSCDTILGTLEIIGSDITSLDSLVGISAIMGQLDIQNCMFTDLSGLDSLQHVGQFLRVRNNDALENLHALKSLTTVEGLLIQLNDALGSLEGLENVDENGLTNLRINGFNMYLCDLPNFCAYVSNGGFATIGGMANTSCSNFSAACDDICFSGGGASFFNQEQVDNFAVFQNGCKTIPGSVYIGPGIANLDSLIGLESVEFLTIDNTSLTSLQGLDSLKNSTTLTIRNNSLLTSFDGLENLKRTSGLTITNNNSLVHLDDLNHLDSVGNLFLNQNANLESISGLQNAQQWGLDIRVFDNPALQSLVGLNQVKKATQMIIQNNDALLNCNGLDSLLVADNLWIFDNQELTSLSGMSHLDTVNNFSISTNPSLANIDDLIDLRVINVRLTIQQNASLTSLSGLEGLSSLDTSLIISNNFSLADCEVTKICQYIEEGGMATIQGNTGNCETAQDVANYCRDCLFGGISFSRQSQIDSFPILYPDCGYIDGDVFITGADITNLDSLHSLFGINGKLWVLDNPLLISFDGLSNLEAIKNSFIISRNNALDSLPEFAALTYLKELQIAQMANLKNMPNLPNLALIDGQLSVSLNPQLTSLAGLDSISFIQSHVFIRDNPRLKNLSGLSGLEASKGFFSVSNLDSLVSLDGIERLYFIGSGGRLIIENNPLLENMDGLNLGQVSLLSIDVKNNPKLTSLNGLNSLVNVSLWLRIQNNASLVDCRSICNLLENGNVASSQIFGNPMSCGSEIEILDHCMDTCNLVVDSSHESTLIDVLECLSVTDTVTFDSCVFGDTIILSAPILIDIPNFNLVADTSWDITIDASAIDHAFIIQSGSTAVIVGINIISGSALDGGAIENLGTLILNDVTILQNSE